MNKPLSGKRIENILCTEQAFPEFPHLLIGESLDKKAKYFDATAYLQSIGLKDCSGEGFLSDYSNPINALATAYGIDVNRVIVQNLEGHLLIESSFIYLFLSYTDPIFLGYLNDRVDELITRGFSVSDDFLVTETRKRIPIDVFTNSDYGDGTDETS